jgi:ribosomal protein S18 acetylase RimI-like enzyme
MTASITLRLATDDDLELLYRIYASTRTEELAIVPWTDAQKEDFLRMQFHAQHTYYTQQLAGTLFQIILADGEPAGRLYVDRHESDIHIVDIALLPNYRGQGIGTSLLNDLIAESEASRKTVSIHVEKYNPAMRLYERLGFRKIGDLEVYDLMERPLPV